MRTRTLNAAASTTCLAALLACAGPAPADQILVVHDASLTTYVPSSKSNIQDVRPLPEQRGVGLDGAPRGIGGGEGGDPYTKCGKAAPVGPADLSPGWDGGLVTPGDLFGPSGGGPDFGDAGGGSGLSAPPGMDYPTGAPTISDVDLAFPAVVPWIIGRNYNCRQKDSGGSYFASSGYQGMNWFQTSQPELVFHDTTPDTSDMIYLVYGADRSIEFKRALDGQQQPSTNTFRAVNGAVGAILLTTGTGPDLATWYRPDGWRMVFFWVGDGDIDDDIEGSIWKVIDPAGNTAYVGHATDAATALSSYDATTGAIATAYDSSGRRFTYTHTSGRLTQVKAEVDESGWVEVGRVEYAYYVGADAHGEAGDLKLVTLTVPLSDSGVSDVRKKHYWYYEGTYNATTNPGYHHQIQYVIDFEGYRRFDWQDATFDDDPLSASENDLKPYAAASFKYDTERRIVAAWFNGACGCSGAAAGEISVEYESNGAYTDGAGYDTAWKSRVIVHQPDVTHKTADPVVETWVTRYFDEVGQPLHTVTTDRDPDDASPRLWATRVVRDGDSGLITEVNTPANVTAYTHSAPPSFTTSSSAGLVRVTNRIGGPGETAGFVDDQRHRRDGTSSTAYFDGDPSYTTRTLSVGDVGVTRALPSARKVYYGSSSTGASEYVETSVSYTFHSGSSTDVQYVAVKQVTTTNPTVSAGNNGSGTATTSKRYLRPAGSTAFVESPDGIFTYLQFTGGQLTKRIDDVKTNGSFPSGDDPNTDFGITESGNGSDRTTTYTYDRQGRMDTTTLPDGRVLKRYHSQLKDGRVVSLSYTKYVASPLTFYGPVQYTVTNHAGRVEVQATVALTGNQSTTALTGHVDETDADPITAMDLGAVARLTVNEYDESGTVLAKSLARYNLAGPSYDTTLYGYDDQGRRVRTKAPHGTITRNEYDSLGRVVGQWIGTNDKSWDGGEPSGTDNMVKTVEHVYDGGNDKGNSALTKRTLFVQDDTTGQRETTFAHDSRGRVLLTTNPAAPHTFSKYDNLGRLTASAQYSSTTNINIASDDPVTETSNRLALSQTFYDEMGRVYKTKRHKIDDADGSDDDNLEELTWYDAAGRVIKRQGPQLAKTAYDRLGRQTRQYTLSKTNDSVYADADDVSGDIVLEESQTVYESTNSDGTLMQVTIERHHDDYSTGETTGALDTNADADDLLITASNLKGRAQIVAMWYDDDLDRLTDLVQFGTYGGADFDRGSASFDDPPDRSDERLRTTHVYHDDGTLKSITDPRNLETRYAYDDAGRQVAVIANYVNGTPSSTTGDDDVHTRYVYTDGLRTKLWVDFDGDNVEDAGTDQVTTYTFGTVKGTSAGDSKIATGHLLKEVKYPDSGGASDVVSHAYDAQGQEIYRKDQSGNVFETDYDTLGRTTHQRVTTLASGFDGAVRRISSTYDSLGRRQLVTQYDDATVGAPDTVINEVKFTYDDWGNLEKLEQDHNSAVGASGSVDDLEVSYAWEKSTSTAGVKTLRRRTMTLPGSVTVTYSYTSTGGLHDADASRVTTVKVGTVEAARYWYNGMASVVGTIHDEPDIFWKRYGSTSGTYPDLDIFNRVTSSRWTKDLSTDLDFLDLDITYDRSSNIERVEDQIHVHGPGWDAAYTMDNLNRLTRAQQGVWTTSLTSPSHDQQWTLLDQVGNWDHVKLDVNGDTDFTDTSEYNDDRTHNVVNELTARDTDDNGTDNFTLTYDALGNLTDDGEHYTYEYDAFGRLRKVKNRSTSALVSEYAYNGLNHRVKWHYDVDADGTVETNSDDPRYYFAYDERWRIVATYRDDDTTSDLSDEAPKERFVYHAAGFAGHGGASYIDEAILRDKDADTAWSAASDGTLEERVYSCHNWRHDVSVLISAAGAMVEWVRYSAYGIPFGIPVGDTNSDGTVNSTDLSNVTLWWGQSTKPTADTNFDGTINATDQSTVSAQSGTTLGWWALSDVGNRKGYAGYEHAPELAGAMWHVRHRVLNSDLGRWTRRDPLWPQSRLYVYAAGSALMHVDPSGLISIITTNTDKVFDPDFCWGECRFNIRLQPPQNPCFGLGFFVQQVTVGFRCSICGAGPVDTELTFYELLAEVQGDETAMTDDTLQSSPPDGTAGYLETRGDAKFFCLEEIAPYDGAGMFPFANWKEGLYSQTCWGTSFFDTGKATVQRPLWWDMNRRVPTSSDHSIALDWCCCGDPMSVVGNCSPPVD